MRRPPLPPLVAAAALLPAAAAAQSPARVVVELEGGAAWQSRNDAEAPNDGSATRFSLADLTGAGPRPAGRVYVTWRVAERHALRVLAAPLRFTERGTFAAPVRFEGATFAPGAPVEATYRFDSYRLTYRYRLRATGRSTLWVGATAKLRDATIALAQGATSARTDDLGFVPLLHLAGDVRVAPRTSLLLDADALAGGPGRAVDASLKLGRDLGGRWGVQGGYRVLEGGADVDRVYSFAWLNYAVLSVTRRF